MSSNIQIQRICTFCGCEFIAKTTVTQLCSPKCRKANYKAKKRGERIEQAQIETLAIKNKSFHELKEKEFLSVKEVSTLLGCSVRTTYRLIEEGKIKGVNLAERMTRIKRSEINRLMEPKQPTQTTEFNINDCYRLNEIRSKYRISDKALYDTINRNAIPKIKKGKLVYIPKVLIDKILS